MFFTDGPMTSEEISLVLKAPMPISTTEDGRVSETTKLLIKAISPRVFIDEGIKSEDILLPANADFPISTTEEGIISEVILLFAKDISPIFDS